MVKQAVIVLNDKEIYTNKIICRTLIGKYNLHKFFFIDSFINNISSLYFEDLFIIIRSEKIYKILNKRFHKKKILFTKIYIININKNLNFLRNNNNRKFIFIRNLDTVSSLNYNLKKNLNKKNKIYFKEKKDISIFLNKLKISSYKFNKNNKNKIFKKEKIIKQRLKFLSNRKCVFLDRDGVINKQKGYILSKNHFKLTPGLGKAIKLLNKKKILVIVITNQSAIARGLLKENELENIHKYFCKLIATSHSAYINDIFYCPYLKNAKIAKYKKNSYLRKPNPGMILLAIKKWHLKKANCIMIGDNITDKKAATNAKIKFFYKKNISFEKQIYNIF